MSTPAKNPLPLTRSIPGAPMKKPNPVIKGMVLGKITKDNNGKFSMEISTTLKTSNVMIEYTDMLYNIEHMDGRNVYLVCMYDKVDNRLTIICPFNTPKVTLKCSLTFDIEKKTVRNVEELSLCFMEDSSSVKRKLNMDNTNNE